MFVLLSNGLISPVGRESAPQFTPADVLAGGGDEDMVWVHNVLSYNAVGQRDCSIIDAIREKYGKHTIFRHGSFRKGGKVTLWNVLKGH